MKFKLAMVAAAVVALPLLTATPAHAISGSYALRVVIPSVNVTDAGLSKVIDYLRNITGANIIVNWKALEAANVTKDTVITLQLSDLSLRKTLETILDEASPTVQLAWQLDGNVIRVTTQEDADKKLMTRVYPVGDLLIPKNTEFNVPWGSQNNANVIGGGNNGGFNGGGNTGGGLFNNGQQQGGTGQNGQGNRTIDFSKDVEAMGQKLIDVIQTAVRPEIWDKNGGKATAKLFDNMLIISAPESVQEAIGGPIRPNERRYGF